MSTKMRPKPRTDAYGFVFPEEVDHTKQEQFESEYLVTLVKMAQMWSKLPLMKGTHRKTSVPKTSKVKTLVRKGIPQEHRAFIWATACGAVELKEANAGVYLGEITRVSRDSQGSADDAFTDVIASINQDVPRTFPNNIYFSNFNGRTSLQGYERDLFNILVLFAKRNAAIGYCQGLNYLVGLILLITKDAEITFWTLQVLVGDILPNDYFGKKMVGLRTDIEVFSELVRQKCNAVYEHLVKLQIPWPVVVTKWFVCLFIDCIPIETVLRVWDCLFYEGGKTVFRVGLTLVMLHQEAILSAQDFPAVVEAFRNIGSSDKVLDCHAFMKCVFKLTGNLSRTTIDKLRNQCRPQMLKDG